jgi:hypothetical protein
VFVSADAAVWPAGLDELHERLGKRFGQAELRRQALAYLKGLPAGLERRNGWATTGRAAASPSAFVDGTRSVSIC